MWAPVPERLFKRLRRATMAAVLTALGSITATAHCQSLPQSSSLLVIAHSPELTEVAQEWQSYRAAQGWRVERIELRADDFPEPLRARIRLHLDGVEQGCSKAVLLLGDADAVPCFLVEQTEPSIAEGSPPQYATDLPYGCADGIDFPDAAVGRVPARTPLEARTVLQKVKRYEMAPSGDWRRRIELVAGEGHFGGFDTLLETLSQGLLTEGVPASMSLRVSYCKPGSPWCPAPSKLRQTVDAQLAAPSLLFNYMGHGSDRSLDQMRVGARKIPILRVEDLPPGPSLELPSRLPIAILVCCSAGHFDRTDAMPCLAESMLFAPTGPVGVIAGSRPTHPYANAILERDALTALCSGRVKELGKLDLYIDTSLSKPSQGDIIDAIATPIALAQGWKTSLPQLRQMHAGLYNLLGDPCTRLALPPDRSTVTQLQIAGGMIRGRVPGMTSGEVTIDVERARQLVPGLIPVDGERDKQLEEKCLANWERANAPLLLQIKCAVVDGLFEAPFETLASPRWAAIRVSAVGESESGGEVEGLGWAAAPILAP